MKPTGRLPARLARNTAFVVAGRLWYVVVWFAITPFVLRHLGVERFGVWSLLFLLSGYLATFDLGLGASIVKFTAEHSARSHWDQLKGVLASILRLYSWIGLAWIAVMFAIHPLLLHSLKIPPALQPEVRFAILTSVVIFALANLVNIGPGVLNGLQRMGLANGILIASSLPQMILLVLGLRAGYGLYAAVVSTAAQWATVGLGSWWALRRVAPQLSWPSFRGSDAPGGWFRFSAVMQINNAIALSQQQVDKLLLASWVGLRSVANFELGFRVANGIQSLPILALGPLLPVFSDLHAQQDQRRFALLWRHGSRLLCSASVLLGVCVVPVAGWLIRAWVGPGYPVAERLAAWLLVGFAINLGTGVASAASRGAGRPGMEVVPGLVGLVLHVVASVILLPLRGESGVGPAFVLGMSATALCYLAAFSRWVRESFWGVLASFWAQPAVCAVPALATALLLSGRVPLGWLGHRAGLLAGSSLVVAGSAIVFLSVWLLLESRRAASVWTVLRGVAPSAAGTEEHSTSARSA